MSEIVQFFSISGPIWLLSSVNDHIQYMKLTWQTHGPILLNGSEHPDMEQGAHRICQNQRQQDRICSWELANQIGGHHCILKHPLLNHPTHSAHIETVNQSYSTQDNFEIHPLSGFGQTVAQGQMDSI